MSPARRGAMGAGCLGPCYLPAGPGLEDHSSLGHTALTPAGALSGCCDAGKTSGSAGQVTLTDLTSWK